MAQFPGGQITYEDAPPPRLVVLSCTRVNAISVSTKKEAGTSPVLPEIEKHRSTVQSLLLNAIVLVTRRLRRILVDQFKSLEWKYLQAPEIMG